ncbi:hypothetical protein GCM10023114_58590 [Mycolicibacterium sediminis]
MSDPRVCDADLASHADSAFGVKSCVSFEEVIIHLGHRGIMVAPTSSCFTDQAIRAYYRGWRVADGAPQVAG